VERQPKDFKAHTKTAHFDVFYQPGETTEAEVSAVSTRAEAGHASLTTKLGADRLPQMVTMVLDGDALGADGSLRAVSHVSVETGAMVLYRFPGEGGGYEASVVHELVHAARLELTREHLPVFGAGWGFVEEGFAEVMAREAGHGSVGFPTYGVPLDVVAGQWLVRGEGLPLTALLKRHGELNGRCSAQAYSQRVSFFTMLAARFGIERVIAWAYSADAVDSARFLKVFGEPMATVFASWEPWARQRYAATPDADALATRYRTTTPVQYVPVCHPADLQ